MPAKWEIEEAGLCHFIKGIAVNWQEQDIIAASDRQRGMHHYSQSLNSCTEAQASQG
jgi:hypothetical protein